MGEMSLRPLFILTDLKWFVTIAILKHVTENVEKLESSYIAGGNVK